MSAGIVITTISIDSAAASIEGDDSIIVRAAQCDGTCGGEIKSKSAQDHLHLFLGRTRSISGNSDEDAVWLGSRDGNRNRCGSIAVDGVAAPRV